MRSHHNHHERVDDVALAKVGADVADLAQRAAGQAGDTRTQREGVGVDACGVDTHAGRDGPVLLDDLIFFCMHVPPQLRFQANLSKDLWRSILEISRPRNT